MKNKLRIIVGQDKRCQDFNVVLAAAKLQGRKEDEPLRYEVCEEVNMDGPLCRGLRNAGHEVFLFDGRDEKDRLTQFRDVKKLTDRLGNLILQKRATAMVWDLQWWKDFQAGVEVLKELVKSKSIPVDMNRRIIIYSMFLNQSEFDFERPLVQECGIPKENLVTRTQKDIYGVMEMIERWP